MAVSEQDDSKTSVSSDSDEDDHTLLIDPLIEASERGDEKAVQTLIEKGFRDDRNRALAIAASKYYGRIMGLLLACKCYIDPEHKINKKNLHYAIKRPPTSMNATSTSTNASEMFTFSAMFPTTPVAINWHGLGHFASIEKDWLIAAALRLNVKLRLPNSALEVSLAAITRLDLSCNNLRRLPVCVFQLQSLRTLDLSQNMIDHLPVSDIADKSKSNKTGSSMSTNLKMKKSISLSGNLSGNSGHKMLNNNEDSWSLPVLEELYLQDNRLDSVCSELFQLPSLQMLDLSNNKLRSIPPEIWESPNLREVNLSLNLLHDLPRKIPRSSVNSSLNENTANSIRSSSIAQDLSKLLIKSDQNLNKPQSAPQRQLTQGNSTQSKTKLNMKLIERPPSVDREANLQNLPMLQINTWSSQVEILHTAYVEHESDQAKQSQLQRLNLSHNSFRSVPAWLSCTAVQLSRLNISYNCLHSMGNIRTYPASIKHIDLSHNQIDEWFTNGFPKLAPGERPVCCPSLGHLQEKDNETQKSDKINCPHQQHDRLEQLKTLIISYNQLTSIKVRAPYRSATYNESGEMDEDFEIIGLPTNKSKPNKLWFASLTMLDISNNRLCDLSISISELINLAVLNISNNPRICRLPPQMGLLNKLWNLNTTGCNLDEPLQSMIRSKKYKTMDIIGYLKSILEDSKPYARMKLMVVGIQGIGKTTLLDLLRHEGTSSGGKSHSHFGLNSTHRRRPPEHWAKRMGHKNMNIRTPRGVTLSTVGVDVYDFTYDKKSKGEKSFGPVTFRTWDFGGQKEYYATHQYFLSRRSLYLVVWRMIDGEKGIDTIHQWLVNIQARAPNSPVIIVGTFYDQLRDYFPRNFSDQLQSIIRQRFINVIDHDKIGIPKVIDSIEVSTKTKYNIKNLCNLIYDTVFSITCPGSKERLLEQKIPATYLALEEIVVHLATERRMARLDPVLRSDEYRAAVLNEMNRRYRFTFRDVTELNQATSFLHENGVLLHYEDAVLSDLYFLDPQWLCDLLAHVVTIREINPYVKHGLMRTEDLRNLFKHVQTGNADIRSYMINLLNKFEVALSWDSRTMLLPSLLPTEEMLVQPNSSVKMIQIPVRGKSLSNQQANRSLFSTLNTPSSSRSSSMCRLLSRPDSNDSLNELNVNSGAAPSTFTLQEIKRPDQSIYRILLMTYFPCGFWSRLIVRLLADDCFSEIMNCFYCFPPELTNDVSALALLSKKPEWNCWQTGIALQHMGKKVFHIKELLNNVLAQEDEFDYFGRVRFLVQQENVWTDVEMQKSSILEMYLPNHSLFVQSSGGFSGVIEPNIQAVTKLIAIAVDHIDVLLEDWYPSLGTRFVHTSDGKFLVTRLVPCPRCLNNNLMPDQVSTGSVNSANEVLSGSNEMQKRRNSREKCLVINSNSTFNIHDILTSSKPSTQDSIKSESVFSNDKHLPTVYCFMIEECILRASESKRLVRCPLHRDQLLVKICPDTVFADLDERFLFDGDTIKRSKMLGRGAFGFVFKASIQRVNHSFVKVMRGRSLNIDRSAEVEVALKTLQPVEPGPGAKHSDLAIYKASVAKWERDPLQYACKAYCMARKELSILMLLHHPHIVPLVGLCISPLALLLQLAPFGALDLLLRDHRRSGCQLSSITIQKALLQIARALEYLHQQHIIYRDLKSENVLVWAFPLPSEAESANNLDSVRVDIRLADYGISRSTLPTGTKGFGGTEGFMAPEIMKYNGEQEYTEKVDVFSFGMFTYELITLRLPFEGHESVKDYILEGIRPKLTIRDAIYPSCLLDLMVRCWSQSPAQRPSASQLVSIVSAPEFVHLLDVMQLYDNFAPLAADVFARNNHLELWLGRLGKQTDVLFSNWHKWHSYKSITSLNQVTVICICVIPDSGIWIGDSKALVHVYSLDGSYLEITNFALEVDTLTAVRSMCYIAPLKIVVLSSTSGRLWLCDRDTFQLREIPLSAPPVLCFAYTEYQADTRKQRSVKSGEKVHEIWCGQSEGCITTLQVKHFDEFAVNFISHYNNISVPEHERQDVFEIVAESHFAWTYLYPGSIVFQWDICTKIMVQKLDCSKLAPCSESLLSISIEQHLNPSKCQVKTMAIMDDELYIGTTIGSLIIVEASKMRPITVFRPFEEEIKIIIPVNPNRLVTFSNQTNEFENEQDSDHDCNDISLQTDKRSRYLITIGKGYRCLFDRYLNPTAEHHQPLVTHPGLHALLWSADSWLM